MEAREEEKNEEMKTTGVGRERGRGGKGRRKRGEGNKE